MNEEKLYEIEIITERGRYGSEVHHSVLQLMLKADIVTVRGQSVRVAETEVTDEGITRFHGNLVDL
ncbi:hypothetical protein AC623_10835 [Bacillus sp. FJAT-27231]|uniref:hypothetical protein n=1 Tax=Bacillus sp. FJAT-27231 TaxID=1679168 RepID=UPI0006708EA8|nr:hypothetical protein [Bacillus sp. FJAT-27231]KMY54362.1 hypothetical protein AC623_10835 [Bacillus sp. FJAT-27231]